MADENNNIGKILIAARQVALTDSAFHVKLVDQILSGDANVTSLLNAGLKSLETDLTTHKESQKTKNANFSAKHESLTENIAKNLLAMNEQFGIKSEWTSEAMKKLVEELKKLQAKARKIFIAREQFNFDGSGDEPTDEEIKFATYIENQYGLDHASIGAISVYIRNDEGLQLNETNFDTYWASYKAAADKAIAEDDQDFIQAYLSFDQEAKNGNGDMVPTIADMIQWNDAENDAELEAHMKAMDAFIGYGLTYGALVDLKSDEAKARTKFKAINADPAATPDEKKAADRFFRECGDNTTLISLLRYETNKRFDRVSAPEGDVVYKKFQAYFVSLDDKGKGEYGMIDISGYWVSTSAGFNKYLNDQAAQAVSSQFTQHVADSRKIHEDLIGRFNESVKLSLAKSYTKLVGFKCAPNGVDDGFDLVTPVMAGSIIVLLNGSPVTSSDYQEIYTLTGMVGRVVFGFVPKDDDSITCYGNPGGYVPADGYNLTLPPSNWYGSLMSDASIADKDLELEKKEQSAEYDGKIVDVEADIVEYESTIAELAAKIAKYTKAIEDANGEIANSQSDKTEAEDNKTKATEKREKAVSMLAEVVATEAESQGLIDGQKQLIDDATAAIAKCNEDITYLKSQPVWDSEAIQQCEETISSSKEIIETATEQKKEFEAEHKAAGFDGQKAEQQEDIDKSDADINAADASIEKSKASIILEQIARDRQKADKAESVSLKADQIKAKEASKTEKEKLKAAQDDLNKKPGDGDGGDGGDPDPTWDDFDFDGFNVEAARTWLKAGTYAAIGENINKAIKIYTFVNLGTESGLDPNVFHADMQKYLVEQGFPYEAEGELRDDIAGQMNAHHPGKNGDSYLEISLGNVQGEWYNPPIEA